MSSEEEDIRSSTGPDVLQGFPTPGLTLVFCGRFQNLHEPALLPHPHMNQESGAPGVFLVVLLWSLRNGSEGEGFGPQPWVGLGL